MRKAILEGLDVEFAMPPLPMNPSTAQNNFSHKQLQLQTLH